MIDAGRPVATIHSAWPRQGYILAITRPLDLYAFATVFEAANRDDYSTAPEENG